MNSIVKYLPTVFGRYHNVIIATVDAMRPFPVPHPFRLTGRHRGRYIPRAYARGFSALLKSACIALFLKEVHDGNPCKPGATQCRNRTAPQASRRCPEKA